MAAPQTTRRIRRRDPIKGTGYFARVRDRVTLPIAWAEGSDRDHVVDGCRAREYYKLADRWLRSEIEASGIEGRDPARAAELNERGAAGEGRDAKLGLGVSEARRVTRLASRSA